VILRVLYAVAVLALVPDSTRAQQPRYRLTPRDTLRYHEVTEARSVMRLPQGLLNVATLHDATVALTGEAADTVRAWYERLALSQTGPTGERRPVTDSALRRPFRVTLPPNGRAATVTAPIFPDQVAQLTDLTHEFEDFFISLPVAALRPGAAWTDTIETTTSGRPQDSYESRRVRSFRVQRDTAIGGTRAVVIAVEQQWSLRATSRVDGEPAVFMTRLVGPEEGTALFAPGAGRLLDRERRGRMEGEFTVEGPERRSAFPQTWEYTSRLRLVTP
jgi:hypothetical protein